MKKKKCVCNEDFLLLKKGWSWKFLYCQRGLSTASMEEVRA